MFRIWHISVVVCLDKVPCRVSKLVRGVNFITVPLDDYALISLNSWYDEVDRASNFGFFESIHCICVVTFLIYDISQEPAGGDIVLNQNADEIVLEVGLSPGIDLNREGSRSVGSQSENTSHNGVDWVYKLVSFVVLDIGDQVGEEEPHVEIQISAVDDLALAISGYHSRASIDGWKFIHEVDEEKFVEGVAW